ncbi:hypothetical protein COCVIDRAFT_111506 [Bipolaris victoriae FI3]|uniref:Uncharacterized protein n=1 Tax=Bipolaris victoriae (strain FI3) TaxID=930091 RepID=W7EDY6_BIPV3|nr:hypothetical protein COCVIDRAFT_111506 [Bipolaris victoriae FI3]
MQTQEERVTCQDIQRASVLPVKLVVTVYPHAFQCSQCPLGGFVGFDNFEDLPLYLPSNRPKRLPQRTENPPSPTLPTPTRSNPTMTEKGRGHHMSLPILHPRVRGNHQEVLAHPTVIQSR